MEQKLTNEEISKVVAMYLTASTNYNVTAFPLLSDLLTGRWENDYYAERLKLTSLEKITDEDAIEVAKICHIFYETPSGIGIRYKLSHDNKPFAQLFHSYVNYSDELDEQILINFSSEREFVSPCSGVTYFSTMSESFQYLNSKGYAVPLFFSPGHWANGKTAIELGIAIDNNQNQNNGNKTAS